MSYTLNPTQSTMVPSGLKTEILTIPAQSTPAFGSGFFTILLNEQNLKCHELQLQFLCSALSGLTGGTPSVVPAQFWIEKIEILMSNTTLQTIYGNEIFIQNQLSEIDEQRKKINIAAGPYDNATVRTALNSVNNLYTVTIPSLFNQSHPTLLTAGHSVLLRVTMRNLSDLVYLNGATGTPIFTIQNCNLVARITRLPPQVASGELMALTKKPLGYQFSYNTSQPFTIQSGASTSTLVLSSITGYVTHLFFVCRSSSTLTANIGMYDYLPITSFAINDSGNTNIVGGQNLSSSFSLLSQGRWNSASSYLTESFTAISSANVYLYAFCVDSVEVMKTGKKGLSGRQFVGNETLQIVFPSPLSSTTQVDVYAYTSQTAVFTPNSVSRQD